MAGSYFDPGTLRQRFALQRPVETSDGCGGLDVTWVDEGGAWGRIEPLEPRTDETAQRVTATSRFEITVRFRGDLSAGWRFVRETRVFQVLTAQDPDETARYLTCLVKEEETI